MRRPPSKAEKAFAKKVRAKRANESQVSFASRLGIAQSTLNRIENCEQSVTLYMVEKIAERLKVKVVDLL